MPAPANDNFASAEVLSGTSGSTSGTTLDATKEASEPAIGSSNPQSVWYKITPSVTGQWNFQILSSSVTNVGVGANGNITFMIFNESVTTVAGATRSEQRPEGFISDFASSAGGGNADLKVQLYAGQTYYLKVQSNASSPGDNTNAASFTLTWALQTGPANDDLANAISFGTPPDTITGQTLLHASMEDNETVDFGLGFDQSVWYEFTPATDGVYRFIINNITNVGAFSAHRFGIVISTGSSHPVSYITKTYDSDSDSETSFRAHLTGGTSYNIKVYTQAAFEFNDSFVSTFDITVEEMVGGTPPANDDFVNAQELGTDPTGPFSGTNLGATYEAFEATNGYAQPSVWYHFTISADGIRTVTVTKTGSDPDWQPYAEFYTDTGGVFDQSADFFDSTGSSDLPTIGSGDINFVAGDYYMAVYNWNFDYSWDDFEIEFGAGPPPPPANDNFANRVILPTHYAATVSGTTEGATTEGSEPNTNPGSHNPPYPSVWYEYTSPNYNHQPLNIIFDTEGSPTDTFLEIFTGSSIGGLTQQGSDHNSGAGGRSKITKSSNGNVNYKIRVSSPPGSEGAFSLKINVIPGGSAPANDNFASAILMTGYSDSESGTTVGATGEYDDRGAGFSGPTGESTNTVWYKWIPPQTGKILLILTGNSSLYTSVWRGTTLAGLVQVENMICDGGDTIALQVEGGVTYYFKVEGGGGYEGTFTIAFQMANVSPPANDDPSNAIVISAVTGVTNITTPTEGALWDSSGPYAGDFVTEADENGTLWWKFNTGDELGSVILQALSETVVNGLSATTTRAELVKGSNIATAVIVAGVNVGQSIEVSLERNETYWVVLNSYYWSTAYSAKVTLQFQHGTHEGVGFDPNNGTSDFDSTTGTFTADAIDGEFVASGGVGYGSIEPWNIGGHYPYGWWCRFDLNSTSGDYLYRYGQTQQHIEFFRATKDGGDYHSLFLVGDRDGTQSIYAGINGSLDYGTGYKVFGLNKFGTSEKVRVEIGENGVTLDGRCFRHADFDFPIFQDTQADQFIKFDFGIITYPGNGSAYVDLDPEWNLRFSNIRIHDNPDECVMGTPVEGVKEVVSIAGWTQGFDYYKPNLQSFRQLGGGTGPNLATVVPSEGDYEGYSLDCSEVSTGATKIKGYGWTATNTQPGVNIYYNPYLDPANDTYFPGMSFRFWINTMPSADLVIAYIAGLDNGCYLYLKTDGTLAIRPSKFSDLIPFCHTEVDKWNYIEFQQDVSTRKYATEIWLDNVYIGRFETTSIPSATNTGVPNRPPMWNSYGIGRLGSVASPSSTFSTTTVGIQFRDVATTRRKIDRPLGPTIVVAKSIEADGTHNYPDPDTFLPGVADQAFNTDFSGGTDGAGQPHYWTGYDRHDSGRPSGAMYLGYLFQTFPDGIVSLATDGSGPPGHTGESALRIESPGSGAGAAYVFGGAVDPAVDQTFDLDYADNLSAQFWLKGIAGQTVHLMANSGIGDWVAFNSHTMKGGWEQVKLWLEPNSVTGTVQLTDVVLVFPDATTGDAFLVKDFHLYVNPLNNPPNFYETSDNGATTIRVPFGVTNAWQFIHDMPPDTDSTQLYTNTRNFLPLVRGKEDDGKTHLPPLWSDHYLEFRFADVDGTENPQVFAAKIILSLKGYNGEGNTNDSVDFETFVQGGYSSFVIANGDGAIRYIGKHAAHISISDADQTFYGIQLPRPPGNGEWNLSAWNDTKLRFMSHDKTFENSLLIVGDFNGAGVVEGAIAEVLMYDRRLSPPSCKQLIGVYTTIELR